MSFEIRKATLEDAPGLEKLISVSARALGREDYSEAQIEAALQGAWGVDTQLIRDGTYFVVDSSRAMAGCGGWSRRKTLFGSDAQKDRKPDLLRPGIDAARIRAFFVHPDFARGGVGRTLLDHCESAARAEGFTSAELVATLPGERLYRRFGYVALERRHYPLTPGMNIEFVSMRKDLAL